MWSLVGWGIGVFSCFVFFGLFIFIFFVFVFFVFVFFCCVTLAAFFRFLGVCDFWAGFGGSLGRSVRFGRGEG